MTISVIIPVYNTSIFLKDCLDSIVNQTHKDLEIICINDGSKDNSLKILEEYQKNDPRIVIINQENKGVSAARNSGLEIARGDYIAFIDSDDKIDANYFEKLYDCIIENDADIAAASILRVKKNYTKTRIKYDKIETFKTLKDKIKAINVPKCCHVWNKLYKRNIVEKFKEGYFYEDIFWTPDIIKKSSKLVTVPDTFYYYLAHNSSIVKNKQSLKKQKDSFAAKKFIIDFFNKNNLELSKKEKNITKRLIYILNFVFLKIKEYENTETYYLLGFIPIFKRKIKKPIIKDNTFIIREPCSLSHSEVVPGYVKYLLDLGYHVSVLVDPRRYKEGLFSRFEEENVSYNKLTRKQAKEFFKNNSLEDIKGVMVTTVGKVCDCIHYNQAYETFSPNVDKKKLLFVEHEASYAANNGTWKKDLITLRKMNYKDIESVVVNPHYFGKIKTNQKNEVTNFIIIGAIRPNKRNSDMIVSAATDLINKGYTNFKITVIGKGSLKHISKEIRKFIDIKGRLPFKKMYEEIEKADFFLMPYNENDKEHLRYITTGTSGNFQLIYGFLKPCILIKSFAPINDLTEKNSILYDKDEDFSNAMEKAINMDKKEYLKMQGELKLLADNIYKTSKENLKNLIEKGTNYGDE